MASPSTILSDQANGARLSRLLVDKGTEVLRKKFDSIHPPSNLAAVLNTNKRILQRLRYKIINASQWDLLYPTSGLPDSQNFDVTLLTILLRNICGLSSPATGWDALPPTSDTSDAANIARIKYYRNKVHAHITKTEFSDSEFENLWREISKAVNNLGVPKSELEELKEAPLSPEEAVYIKQLDDWVKQDAHLTEVALENKQMLLETNVAVKEIQQTLQQQSRGGRTVSEVDKLCKCDFSGTIKSLNKMFLPGTRQWLFDELNTWFADENSDSTVMILTAGPGVGKSVFAAKVCRTYSKLRKLAAVHFCKYNKSDYRNPRRIIESLASIMCDNVEGFKSKLDDQLQRNHSQETISDAFRVLLNDPLHALEEREPMLLVIDALDESETGGKSEFLELISEEFPNLPQWMKILITSRPELQVQEELHHLNPVHITPRNTNNKEDLLRYLQHFLSPICSDDTVLKSLAWRCEGSFLYAYHTQMELKKNAKKLTAENFLDLVPKGISGFYKQQFERLRKQLNAVSSSDVMLKRFLEVLVAAEGFLPLSLLPECLGLPDDSKYEVREAINEVMSLILPVYNDCLTVYHKSLIDWLTSVGYKVHAFTVDSQSGHKFLWRICEKVFNEIVSLNELSSVKTDPLKRYALARGISHMIQSGSEASYHWSVDVKIVYARTMMHPYQRRQMKEEWLEIVKKSISSLKSDFFQQLNWHVRLFQRAIRPYEDSAFYLQYIANSIYCSNEKRSAAKTLLKQGQHFWFEDLDAKQLTNRFYKSVPLRTDVTCIGVSHDEQLVAVGYKDGWISIFRLSDFQEVHVFNTMPESKVDRSKIFSPDKFMLLYDEYGRFVFPNEGETSLFGGNYGALWSCSFSPSSSRLVTCDGSDEIKLWDVNGGNLVARLQAGGPVDCCSFSECGLFIVASRERKEDRFVSESDVFTLWSTLTQQRVDERNIRTNFRFLADRNKTQLLLSCNGDFLDVFQLPEALFAVRLSSWSFPCLLPATRYHWRDCVFRHTNESIKLTEVNQLMNMIEKRRCCLKLPYISTSSMVRTLSLFFIGCPCSYLKSTRVVPIQVRGLYIVPYFAQLNIFGVGENPSAVSFVSEPYVIKCCCFSPDGSFLATCANGDPLTILVWDTKLCTVVQVLRFLRIYAGGCWWSESCFWIYDGGLLKIRTYNNEQPLDPLGAQRVEINWSPTKVLIFSDVVIFVDHANSVNVARFVNGELPYVETLPVDEPCVSAAVSPCNSVIFMASLTTFYVLKEYKTSSSLHWLVSNTRELSDFSFMKDSEGQPLVTKDLVCKCCITSDVRTGVLACCFDEKNSEYGSYSRSYLILVDLNTKVTKVINSSTNITKLDMLYTGNSYCIKINKLGGNVVVEKLTNGKVVAEWMKHYQLDFLPLLIAHSRNDLLVIISSQCARIEFFKIVVPET